MHTMSIMFVENNNKIEEDNEPPQCEMCSG